jgi:predicted SprT family Zn-dependent metalloprotease
MTQQQVKKIYNLLKSKFCSDLNPEQFAKIHLTFNKRLKKSFGRCSIHGEIELSSHFVQNGSEEDIIDTIKHELAHFIAYCKTGRLGHCRTWKRIFLAMGGTGEVKSRKKGLPSQKYGIACTECGHICGTRHVRKLELRRFTSKCCKKPLAWVDMHALEAIVCKVKAKRS